jgi:hypothetical protein
MTLRFDLDLRESLGRRLRPEALVAQQDRNLVMGEQGVLDLDLEDDLDAAYRAIAAHRPLALGRYLLRKPQDAVPPWRYEAVVHDLDTTPSSRPGDVRRSLAAILDDAARRGVRALACEPLGVHQHHGLTFEEMVDAFDAAVVEVAVSLAASVRLTLLLDDLEDLEEISTQLRARVLRRASRSFRTVDGDAAVVEIRQGGARLHVRFVPGSLSGYMVSRVGHAV